MDEGFLEELHAALPAAGYTERSQFIRDAVIEKLERSGIRVTVGKGRAPSRLGKGGPKPKGNVIKYEIPEIHSEKAAEEAERKRRKKKRRRPPGDSENPR